MFGKNIVLKPAFSGPAAVSETTEDWRKRISGETLSIKNIFPTIQGEGPHAGEPAIFIRLAGCNLRCHFCDTDFDGGVLREVHEIMSAVEVIREQYPQIDLVVLTGGEPLRQQIIPLCCTLDEAGFTTQIETAGTVWPPEARALRIAGYASHETLDDMCKSGAVELVCSPKTPKIVEQVEELCEHFKYIIRAGECNGRGLPNRSTQDSSDKGSRWHIYAPHPDNVIPTIWLQPCFEYQARENNTPNIALPDIERNRANAAECVKQAMKHGHRISMQLHKMLDIE